MTLTKDKTMTNERKLAQRITMTIVVDIDETKDIHADGQDMQREARHCLFGQGIFSHDTIIEDYSITIEHD